MAHHGCPPCYSCQDLKAHSVHQHFSPAQSHVQFPFHTGNLYILYVLNTIQQATLLSIVNQVVAMYACVRGALALV